MKIVATLTILLISNFSLAQSNLSLKEDKIICGTYYAFKYKKEISRLPGTDKLKHCTISCQISRKCGPLEANAIGYLKELADLLGMGTPDQDDIRANQIGIQLSKETNSKNDCLILCKREF